MSLLTKMARLMGPLVLVLLVTACQSERTGLPAEPGATAAADIGLTVRARPGGQYFVGTDQDPVNERQLADRLRREDPERYERAIHVLGYQGVVGYDVVVLMNAAQDAGFTRAAGVANYRDEPSSAGPYPERWEMDLSQPRRITPDQTPQ